MRPVDKLILFLMAIVVLSTAVSAAVLVLENMEHVGGVGAVYRNMGRM